MSKVLKYVLPVAAVALPFAFPATMAALGTAVGAGAGSAGMVGSGLTGALLSGTGSALSGAPVGQSLLSSALGGVGGALAGGGGAALSEAAGLTGTAADVASGALSGAAYGGATGGAKGALQGALTGGIGGGIAGALDGVSSSLDMASATPMTGETAALMGSGAGSTTALDMSGLTTGSGLAAGGGASAMGGSGMNLSDALKLGGSLYSGYAANQANEEMKKQLIAAQQQAAGALSPYTTAGGTAAGQLSQALTEGFNYEDYANTPAYQFQLSQGQEALNKQLAAQGMGQSGAAVKAATEYATNLANQNYSDAYNQWIQRNQQLQGLTGTGAGAATGLGNIYGNIGMANAGATAASQNAINQMLGEASVNPLTLALLRGAGSMFG